MKKYMVQFDMINSGHVFVDSESEEDAWEMVQDKLWADTLEAYCEDSYDTKVTDVTEVKR